ncbi:hypothetical protein WAI453_010991 [Rhynchosporium graminicola]
MLRSGASPPLVTPSSRLRIRSPPYSSTLLAKRAKAKLKLDEREKLKSLRKKIIIIKVKIIKEGSKKHREFYTRDKKIKVKEDNYNSNNIIIKVSTDKEEDNKEEFSK